MQPSGLIVATASTAMSRMVRPQLRHGSDCARPTLRTDSPIHFQALLHGRPWLQRCEVICKDFTKGGVMIPIINR